MKILITEDDPIYADALEILLESIGHQVVGIANNAPQALRLIKATQPDLLLLNIEVNGKVDGIYIAQELREYASPIPFIFITSLQDPDIFEKAKRTNPFAYITKPVDKCTLLRTVELALYKYTQQNDFEEIENRVQDEESFFVKVGRQLRRIHVSDICYLKVDRKYSTIALEDEKFKTRMSLQDLARKLPADAFIKVHKSYMVNLQKIDEVDLDKESIKMGPHVIPLSRRHKKELVEMLTL
ncbi:LytR/AlgR family response regulator transcription factor [Microscilla marina]|uniref:Transcriptional regulator n=1 Tax=Microscilla marina ATCC 23134 TaxID=313606 RepID=A1ZXK5_MICM2|nr:LytTR family transcriptional regulator DNA-binding domain-containing protein [Microscilla marina]EAY24880.1 transcriptional regulator [Microscilla marina ATCC 23134]